MRAASAAAAFLPAVLLCACTAVEGGTVDASTDVLVPEHPCNQDLLERVRWVGPNFCCGGDSGIAPTSGLAADLVVPETPADTVCSQGGGEVVAFCTCTFGCVTLDDGGNATCVWEGDGGED